MTEMEPKGQEICERTRALLIPAKRLEPLLTETEELIKILYTIIQNSKKISQG